MVTITGIISGSPADKVGVKAGMLLISINGHSVRDVLDYMFYASETEVNLLIEDNHEQKTFHIEKDEYDDLGLEFESFLMDKKQSCSNKCVFCFIDQMPPGMRETLYFKDDDARLSFLQGNYVTLTNMSQEDVDRIIEMKLNINVSVHTTNPELRVKMMHNRFAGEKLKFLWQMAEAGIKLNCQIVLCPQLNDGAELERTLTDFGKMLPNITSVAVVPVGLSKYRKGLYPLIPFTKETAGNAIDTIERYQQQFLEKFGTRAVFPSDEFFLIAERPIPPEEYYEEYPQYENGVGMLRSLADEFHQALDSADPLEAPRNVSVATGRSPYEFLCKLFQEAQERIQGLQIHPYCIRNDFFGESITVTGLITGQDLVAQLKGQELGDELLLSSAMIRRDSDVFLDDYTISQVEEALNIKIRIVPSDGWELLDALMGIVY
ncbi:MAG TPA: radical SAM protein [Ruminococcus sp.]|nr:radical SAM protein [Ruminococcus sp.]